METKIATSINQSKKLIELGLSADTADMYYWKENVFNNTFSAFNGTLHVRGYSKPKIENTIHAWSLSRLLELMPNKIRNSRELTIYKGENGYKNAYSLAYYFHDEDYPIIKDGVNLLDAAFEMVCYLLKNKLI